LRQQQTASRDGNLSFRASTRAHHQNVKGSYGGGGGSSKLFFAMLIGFFFWKISTIITLQYNRLLRICR
jgi:hypothetical protein